MLLIRKVMNDLHEAKSAIEHIILSTQNIEDFVSYKFLIGKLNGLDIAINICQIELEKVNDKSY